MTTLSHYANLRSLLQSMEEDLQFAGLSDIDKRVVSTLVILGKHKDGAVHLNDIRDHALTASIPAPSLYRSFQTLISKGMISKIGSERSGLYKLES